MDYIRWVAIKFDRFSGITDEFFELLAMNGYTYDVTFSNEGNKTLFIAEQELDYVLNSLNERGIDHYIQ